MSCSKLKNSLIFSTQISSLIEFELYDLHHMEIEFDKIEKLESKLDKLTIKLKSKLGKGMKVELDFCLNLKF